MMEVQRQLSKAAGVPFTAFDGDQADYRNYSEAQFETRIQGLVEVMKQAKEARENGQQVLVVRMNKNKKFQKEQLAKEGYEEFVEFFNR